MLANHNIVGGGGRSKSIKETGEIRDFLGMSAQISENDHDDEGAHFEFSCYQDVGLSSSGLMAVLGTSPVYRHLGSTARSDFDFGYR